MKNFAGYFLSLYCLWKIAMSLYYYISEDQTRDPVTNGLQKRPHYRLQIDIGFYAHNLSFLFVGFLVFSNVEVFCLTCETIYSDIKHEFVSCIWHIFDMANGFACFFCIAYAHEHTQNARRIVTEVLEAIQFSFYQHWFEEVFLLSVLNACGCICIKQTATK